ncbi:uncharacterized protein V1518DRAFT_429477 [Limtongia smithiae]|uniref:uncharacterized protein n=1 Tax=Limtongia smithiae TaxID=1125753 RepID=UPI0034CF1DBD
MLALLGFDKAGDRGRLTSMYLSYRKVDSTDGVLGYESSTNTTSIILVHVDSAPSPLHVAFRAANEAQVQDFYTTAVAHGGVETPPGI